MPPLRFGPPPPPTFEITPSAAEVAFFRENGFLAVERITSDEEVLWLRRIFEFIFSAEQADRPGAPIDRSAAAPAEPSRLRQAFFPELRFPELLETTFRRNAKRYAAALLGVDEGLLSSWGHLIEKPADGRAAAWHQDHAYWEPEFAYCALGVWLPLHDVSIEMGCMQFIPGSHKRGLLPHRHLEAPVHNLLCVDDKVDPASAVACPLKTGGATFHHFETLHYTAPNQTHRPRLAYPMEFQLAPVRKEIPEEMPWVLERRAQGGTHEPVYVADGKIVSLGD
jgi:ectoine hydroxylase-related dioxygenase (phytanoyl-CoA dioxygenase family)